jgi:hypothetical protein
MVTNRQLCCMMTHCLPTSCLSIDDLKHMYAKHKNMHEMC